jgi:hypothetical protein
MKACCNCNLGFPVICEIQPEDGNSFLARHCCSHCATDLFEILLKPGTQVIATENIMSHDGKYVIPKGRLMRITAFVELPSLSAGFLFSGLLAVGAFLPYGFATEWDIEKILSL